MKAKIKILFVCMGNICRSPSAQVVFEKLIENKNIQGDFIVDSAGTHSYHVGAKADSRSRHFASQRGIDLFQQRARKVTKKDFEYFDYIIAMDDDNIQNLKAICPLDKHVKLYNMMSFANSTKYSEVPDPYYGGEKGFDLVLDLLENANIGLLQHLQSNH